MSAPPAETRADGWAAAASAMRADLADGLFYPVYQPFVNLATGRVQGYEVFLRRNRPGTDSQPGAFLPEARGSGLICELDAWVLRQATMQLADWHQRLGVAELILAVNVADEHVREARVITDVFTALDASAVQPDRLLLDVVGALPTHDGALTHLTILRRLGVTVCADLCSLPSSPDAELSWLPVDIVKLQPDCLTASHAAPERVTNRVQAIQQAGLPIVAIGIETDEQLEFAKNLGCEWGQGFHLGAPLPADLIPMRTA